MPTSTLYVVHIIVVDIIPDISTDFYRLSGHHLLLLLFFYFSLTFIYNYVPLRFGTHYTLLDRVLRRKNNRIL